MKKRKVLSLITSIAIISMSLVACGNKTESISKSEVKQQTTSQVSKEKTQDEINNEIKSKAQKADFAKINGHESDFTSKETYIEGEVTNITKDEVLPSFTVSCKEGDGYGMYEVINLFKADIKKGDKVKVYGKLSGDKSSIGLPQLSGNIIEKK